MAKKYRHIHVFVSQLDIPIRSRELVKRFGITHTTAKLILIKHDRFEPTLRNKNKRIPKYKQPQKVQRGADCEPSLDENINYHDAERRAATRERIKANRG